MENNQLTYLCQISKDKINHPYLKRYIDVIIFITVVYAMVLFAGEESIIFTSLARATNNVVLVVLIIMTA